MINCQKYIGHCIWVFLIIIVQSCGINKLDEEQSLFNSFFQAKEEYMECFSKELIKEKRKALMIQWQEIIKNREKALSYLFSLENDYSYSLYGDGALEENPITIQRLPNHFHALYLIECIIQNDYLFNRRFFNSTFIKKNIFFHDGSNIIITRKDTFGIIRKVLLLRDNVNLDELTVSYKFAWDIYKNWFQNEYRFNKKLGESPLNSTDLCWNSLSLLFNRKKTPTVKEWEKMGVFGDTLVIGNGW